jgi:hypothetical protein
MSDLLDTFARTDTSNSAPSNSKQKLFHSQPQQQSYTLPPLLFTELSKRFSSAEHDELKYLCGHKRVNDNELLYIELQSLTSIHTQVPQHITLPPTVTKLHLQQELKSVIEQWKVKGWSIGATEKRVVDFICEDTTQIQLPKSVQTKSLLAFLPNKLTLATLTPYLSTLHQSFQSEYSQLLDDVRSIQIQLDNTSTPSQPSEKEMKTVLTMYKQKLREEEEREEQRMNLERMTLSTGRERNKTSFGAQPLRSFSLTTNPSSSPFTPSTQSAPTTNSCLELDELTFFLSNDHVHLQHVIDNSSLRKEKFDDEQYEYTGGNSAAEAAYVQREMQAKQEEDQFHRYGHRTQKNGLVPSPPTSSQSSRQQHTTEDDDDISHSPAHSPSPNITPRIPLQPSPPPSSSTILFRATPSPPSTSISYTSNGRTYRRSYNY